MEPGTTRAWADNARYIQAIWRRVNWTPEMAELWRSTLSPSNQDIVYEAIQTEARTSPYLEPSLSRIVATVAARRGTGIPTYQPPSSEGTISIRDIRSGLAAMSKESLESAVDAMLHEFPGMKLPPASVTDWPTLTVLLVNLHAKVGAT